MTRRQFLSTAAALAASCAVAAVPAATVPNPRVRQDQFYVPSKGCDMFRLWDELLPEYPTKVNMSLCFSEEDRRSGRRDRYFITVFYT